MTEDLIIYRKTISGSAAEYADFPENLHPDIKDFLVSRKIGQLYTHQAETYQKAAEGKNLVITTPTASGKSLCFFLPVIDAILKDPLTRALFVYPTKALAADQYRALLPWMEYLGRDRLDAGVYDGDTVPRERSRIRKQANIILTNPEMLNGAMLPNHSKYGFDFIFSNLKYLVQPPKITGKDQNYYGRKSVVGVTAELLPEIMAKGDSFITFAKSRKNVEIILKETRDRLEGASFLGTSSPDEISGYRGGYTPKERKEIERKMISGELKGLISTNALELGIDIGKVSTTVLAGYPGTRAAFWQQTGRAGRKGKAHNYMILDQQPMDQYLALDPGWLFEGSSESAVVDPDNLLIELAHIRAAAAELPLSLDDGALFPDLGETIPVLLKMQEVRSQNGRFAWCGGQYPAGEFSMRNIDQNKYQLINKETGKNITEMDEEQAFHEIHPGAVYMHDGDFYQVVEMNLESKMVYAVPFSGNYYTVPGSESNIRIIHSHKEKEWKLI